MAAYLICDINVHDAAMFDRYRAAVPPFVAKHGGEYLVRGGPVEVAEGDWSPQRCVLIRFPDRAAVRAFLDDPEYEPVAELRFRSANSNLIIAEGL